MSNKKRWLLITLIAIPELFCIIGCTKNVWFLIGVFVLHCLLLSQCLRIEPKQKPIKEQCAAQLAIIEAAQNNIKEIQANCPHPATFEWFNSNPSTVCSACNKNLYE